MQGGGRQLSSRTSPNCENLDYQFFLTVTVFFSFFSVFFSFFKQLQGFAQNIDFSKEVLHFSKVLGWKFKDLLSKINVFTRKFRMSLAKLQFCTEIHRPPKQNLNFEEKFRYVLSKIICFKRKLRMSLAKLIFLEAWAESTCLRAASFEFQLEFNWKSIRICSGLPQSSFL